MTIHAFPTNKITPITPAKPKAKQKATLAVVPLVLKPGQVFDEHALSGTHSGTLKIGDKEYVLDDGHTLGLIAHICQMTSVSVTSPSLQESVLVSARKNIPPAVLQITSFGEQVFFKRLHAAMYKCVHAEKQDRAFIDWWENELYPQALALVPADMQVNPRLKRGVYDENGVALTAQEISSRARHARMVAKLSEAGTADGVSGLGFIAIPWEHIVRMEDPHDAVAINGPAYLAVQRMLVSQGFPRMPNSFAELFEGHTFCETITMNQRQLLLGDGPSDDYKEAILQVHKKYHPEQYPLFEACLNGDEALITKLQEERDWLLFLAKEYKEPEKRDGFSESQDKG
jgi:hypothetical protein